MPPRDSDPPPSESNPTLGNTDAPASDPTPPPASDATPTALAHEIVEDFLSRPLTLQWITALLKRRVAPQ